MKYVLACAAVVVVLGLPPTADARPRIGIPANPTDAWCRDAAQVHGPALLIPGFGEAIAKCMDGHHMRHDVRNCLIATGITLAGVAIGDIIGAVAARAIASDMIKVGTAECVALIVGT